MDIVQIILGYEYLRELPHHNPAQSPCELVISMVAKRPAPIGGFLGVPDNKPQNVATQSTLLSIHQVKVTAADRNRTVLIVRRKSLLTKVPMGAADPERSILAPIMTTDSRSALPQKMGQYCKKRGAGQIIQQERLVCKTND